jgi:peptide/nickel transport system substrate-binding protein
MLALDRQRYVDLVYKGEAKVDGLVHWSLGDYALPPDELDRLQPHDPAEAKSLIKAATGEDTLDVTVMFPADAAFEEHNLHLPLWLEQMKAAGFNVKQDPQAFGTWLDNYTTLSYDASLAPNQVYEWAEVNMDFLHSEGPARNNIFAAGIGKLYPEIDRAIDDAKAITDPAAQASKTRDVQRDVYAKGPTFLPLVTAYSFTLYQPQVKNIPLDLGSSGLFLNTWYLSG